MLYFYRNCWSKFYLVDCRYPLTICILNGREQLALLYCASRQWLMLSQYSVGTYCPQRCQLFFAVFCTYLLNYSFFIPLKLASYCTCFDFQFDLQSTMVTGQQPGCEFFLRTSFMNLELTFCFIGVITYLKHCCGEISYICLRLHTIYVFINHYPLLPGPACVPQYC